MEIEGVENIREPNLVEKKKVLRVEKMFTFSFFVPLNRKCSRASNNTLPTHHHPSE